MGHVAGEKHDIGGGEILGVGGVDGNGQQALAQVIAGQQRLEGGDVRVDGRSVRGDVVVYAIGDTDTLAQALELPGGVTATLDSFPGVTVEVFERDDLQVAPARIEPFEHGTTIEE